MKAIRFRDALRVKSAEFWLLLGQPEAALLELQKISSQAITHPWVQQVFRSASQDCSAYFPVHSDQAQSQLL